MPLRPPLSGVAQLLDLPQTESITDTRPGESLPDPRLLGARGKCAWRRESPREGEEEWRWWVGPRGRPGPNAHPPSASRPPRRAAFPAPGTHSTCPPPAPRHGPRRTRSSTQDLRSFQGWAFCTTLCIPGSATVPCPQHQGGGRGGGEGRGRPALGRIMKGMECAVPGPPDWTSSLAVISGLPARLHIPRPAGILILPQPLG